MRVKTGTTRRARHKKLLNQTKGFQSGRKNLYRLAKQAVLKAGENSFAHRKVKKREFRALWIIRINAALKPFEMKYSTFINLIHKHGILLDRKILAKLAYEYPQEFNKIVEKVK